MAMYEWLTVAAIASTIFAVMMIVIQTRRAQMRRDNARRNRFVQRKYNQRKGD
jgi:hypothetical protein